MEPYWEDSLRKVYNKDCRNMSELPDDSIQCVVTSPPYWGLRKYSGDQDLIWGGDNHHEHSFELKTERVNKGNDINFYVGRGTEPPLKTTGFRQTCGAWRGAYGLEPTPEMYVEHTIEILREIKRVLRKDGVVFWNIGDSYNSAASNQSGNLGNAAALKQIGHRTPLYKGLKPKDLCLIPFRVAIAAQNDGWWIRSVIIWSKPNPMPESVKNRPTESHEYILMLTKSAKYYWDMDAVREVSKDPEDDLRRIRQAKERTQPKGTSATKDMSYLETWSIGEPSINPNGRNIRTVWEFPTQPYPEAHFAVFPEKLPETCIKAASKEGDIILDPFAGAGTTLKVAASLGRKSVGYELSEEYCELIIKRNMQHYLTAEALK